MSSNAFETYANSVRMATSTTSVLAGPFPSYADCIVVTNNSDSNAWVYASVDPATTAAFPTLNDQNGAPGQEVLAHSQVALGFSSCMYVATVLLSGTGTITISAGDGL